MKQAHAVCGGAKRRGREKRRGRNEGECGKLITWLTPYTRVANGKETLGGVRRSRRAGDDQDVL
jgi:hypothetical protein